jgi:hypothetical protein
MANVARRTHRLHSRDLLAIISMAQYAELVIGRAFARPVGYCALRLSIMIGTKQKARRGPGFGDNGKAISIANRRAAEMMVHADASQSN